MIYSIIPEHIIFGEYLNKEIKELKEIEYMGQKVQAVELENNQYEIQRLISSEPKNYLNPMLQPGTIINMSFSEQANKEI